MWTLQEAVLAKKIIIGCGSKWLQWDELLDLFKELRNKQIDWLMERYTGARVHRTRTMTGAMAVHEIESLMNQYDPAVGIYIPYLLDASRVRACKEPVDHLWGILGLVHPNERARIRSWGWVDYTTIGKAEFWCSYVKFAKWMTRGN